MPINKIPTKAFTTVDLIVDAFTATDAQTELTLSAPTTANACIVTVNDVLQVPTTDYTVTDSTLTFTSALALNDSINVRILTRPVGFVTVNSGEGGLTEEVDLSNYYTKSEVDAMIDDIIEQLEGLAGT
jgi:hypothetical protein